MEDGEIVSALDASPISLDSFDSDSQDPPSRSSTSQALMSVNGRWSSNLMQMMLARIGGEERDKRQHWGLFSSRYIKLDE